MQKAVLDSFLTKRSLQRDGHQQSIKIPGAYGGYLIKIPVCACPNPPYSASIVCGHL